jgi:hypothetical protein
MALSDDRELMASFLEGTCNTITQACYALDLDEGIDWEDELLNCRPSIECCSDCGYWIESSQVEVMELTGKILCEQCFDTE